MLRWGALLLACSGCADVIGLSGLVYDRPDAAGGAGGGGGAGGDAGSGGEGGQGGAPPPCPGFLFGDDFADGRLAPGWDTVISKATIDEANGELTAAATDVGAYARLETDDGYSLPLGWVQVELTAPAPAGDTALARLVLVCSTGTFMVSQQGSTLYFTHRTTLNDIALWDGPYDSVEHRFLRVRATADQRILEASRDGEGWAPLAELDEGDLPELLSVIVGIGIDGNTDPTASASFDNLLVCAGP
jgi:hypothetical protein